jgi:hypothetical protein
MRSFAQNSAFLCVILALATRWAHAQTVEGDVLRGQGAFLRGAGAFNLNTAKANSINIDATIRWKADLRKIQQERAYAEAQKAAGKKQNVAEVLKQMAEREQLLRTNPSADDVQSGAALNALVYDLTDPDIDSQKWKSVSPVPLPKGTSVKELIFSFTPHRSSSLSSAALSRGVIALSRLEIKDKWPTLLKKDELAKERKAYEDAYLRVRDKVLKGDYAVEEILAIDTAIANLKAKVNTEIPLERNFRLEASRFVDDLKDATRMFDASSGEYAREILLDTKDHDATTVEELVAFMNKYRLQFATSERSPSVRELYGQVYGKLRQQAEKLNIKPDLAALNTTISLGGIQGDPAAAKKAKKANVSVRAAPGFGRNEPVGDPGFLALNSDGDPANLNFENGTLEGWKATGGAFNGQPSQLEAKGKRYGFTGTFLVDTWRPNGDRPQGTLTSKAFMVSHPYASYLIGGASKPETRVEIVTADDDKVFHTARGKNHGDLGPVIVDMRKIMGRPVFIRIVDQFSGGWGHIKFDDFRFHRDPPRFQ